MKSPIVSESYRKGTVSRHLDRRSHVARKSAGGRSRIIREQEQFGELIAAWRRKIARASNIPEGTKRILAQLTNCELAIYLEQKRPRADFSGGAIAP